MRGSASWRGRQRARGGGRGEICARRGENDERAARSRARTTARTHQRALHVERVLLDQVLGVCDGGGRGCERRVRRRVRRGTRRAARPRRWGDRGGRGKTRWGRARWATRAGSRARKTHPRAIYPALPARTTAPCAPRTSSLAPCASHGRAPGLRGRLCPRARRRGALQKNNAALPAARPRVMNFRKVMSGLTYRTTRRRRDGCRAGSAFLVVRRLLRTPLSTSLRSFSLPGLPSPPPFRSPPSLSRALAHEYCTSPSLITL